MRWKIILGALLLLWVLGAAYYQARRRGKKVGAALLFLGGALFCFFIAAFSPRPPLTDAEATLLVIASVMLLALAMGVLLVRGFTGLRR